MNHRSAENRPARSHLIHVHGVEVSGQSCKTPLVSRRKDFFSHNRHKFGQRLSPGLLAEFCGKEIRMPKKVHEILDFATTRYTVSEHLKVTTCRISQFRFLFYHHRPVY